MKPIPMLMLILLLSGLCLSANVIRVNAVNWGADHSSFQASSYGASVQASLGYSNILGEDVQVVFTVSRASDGAVVGYAIGMALNGQSGTVSVLIQCNMNTVAYQCSSLDIEPGSYNADWEAFRASDANLTNPLDWARSYEWIQINLTGIESLVTSLLDWGVGQLLDFLGIGELAQFTYYVASLIACEVPVEVDMGGNYIPASYYAQAGSKLPTLDISVMTCWHSGQLRTTLERFDGTNWVTMGASTITDLSAWQQYHFGFGPTLLPGLYQYRIRSSFLDSNGNPIGIAEYSEFDVTTVSRPPLQVFVPVTVIVGSVVNLGDTVILRLTSSSGYDQSKTVRVGQSWVVWDLAEADYVAAANTIFGGQFCTRAFHYPTVFATWMTPNCASTPLALYQVTPRVVVTGRDGRVYYNAWSLVDQQGWTGKIFTGYATDGPGAAQCGGAMHVVVRGHSNTIWYGQMDLTRDAFSGWQRISGATVSRPGLAAAVDPSLGCSLFLVVRGADNRIWLSKYSGGSWSSWAALPGLAFEGPAVALLNGILYIVVRGLGGTIWFGRYDTQAGAFLGWVKLDGATPSSPALVAANGNLYLAVRGLDNRVYVKTWSGSWSIWLRIPTGTTAGGPAISVDSNVMIVFVKGTDGSSIYYNRMYMSTSTWLGWTREPGATPSDPNMAS